MRTERKKWTEEKNTIFTLFLFSSSLNFYLFVCPFLATEFWANEKNKPDFSMTDGRLTVVVVQFSMTNLLYFTIDFYRPFALCCDSTRNMLGIYSCYFCFCFSVCLKFEMFFFRDCFRSGEKERAKRLRRNKWM